MGLTWTCMVCGAERPDHKISVVSKEGELGNTRATWKVNVRYCNDSDECFQGAGVKADEMLKIGTG